MAGCVSLVHCWLLTALFSLVPRLLEALEIIMAGLPSVQCPDDTPFSNEETETQYLQLCGEGAGVQSQRCLTAGLPVFPPPLPASPRSSSGFGVDF